MAGAAKRRELDDVEAQVLQMEAMAQEMLATQLDV